VSWLSPTIIVLTAVSLALGIALVWWLRRVPEPFLPLNVLRNPVMRVGTAATSWMMGAVLGLTVYMPLYFQVVHKLSATDAGIALIPIVLMTTPGSILSGRSMMYLRRYKVSAIAGGTLAIASMTALAVWPAMPLYGVVIVLTLIGFGAGTVYPVATVSIQNAVPAHRRHRDRRHELLPRAREHARGRDHGRDPAGGSRATPSAAPASSGWWRPRAPPASTWRPCSAGCSWRRMPFSSPRSPPCW
jgi:hypothetical protein